MAARSGESIPGLSAGGGGQAHLWNQPEFYAELAAERIGIVNLDQPCSATRCRRRHAPPPRSAISACTAQLQGLVPQDGGKGRALRLSLFGRRAEPMGGAHQGPRGGGERTDVYVVNNNHFAGQAVTNALMLESQVTGRRVKVPRRAERVSGELAAIATNDRPEQGSFSLPRSDR